MPAFLTFWIFISLCIGCVACGVRGSPLPPIAETPQKSDVEHLPKHPSPSPSPSPSPTASKAE